MWLSCLACEDATVHVAGAALGNADAQEVAKRYIQLFQAEDWTSLEELYSESFYQSMPLDTWRRVLPNVRDELGALQVCELATWQALETFTEEFRGTEISLHYQCTHTKHAASLSFVMRRPRGAEFFEIHGQTFNSLGLLLE